MVASIPTSETKKLNQISSLAKPTKPTQQKMEVSPTSFENLFRGMSSTVSTGNLDTQTLDEWLANDLQQTGFLSEGDEGSAFSSPCSPPLTDADGSPAMGFEVLGDDSLFGSPIIEEDTTSTLSSPMITPASILERSPVLEHMFPELGVSGGFAIPTTHVSAPAVLSPEFVMPWNDDGAPVDGPLATPILVASAAISSTRPHAGKTKATKRPAEADPTVMDDVIIKRQKNTDAARRSRLKKVMKMEFLEQRVSSLEAENSKLVLRVAVLESEKVGLSSKELDYEKRVKKLEQQLADAHKALTSRMISSP